MTLRKYHISCPKKTKFLTLCVAILFTNLLVLVATVPTYGKQKEIWPPDYRNTHIHKKSSISKYLSECEHPNYILNLNQIFDNLNDSDTNKPDTLLSFHNLIQANTQTLHTLKHTNSNLLLFLEAVYIKCRKPVLNIGLRASKELVVFSCITLYVNSVMFLIRHLFLFLCI